MATIRFTATENIQVFNGEGVSLNDLDTVELNDETAGQVLEDYPDNFELISGTAPKPLSKSTETTEEKPTPVSPVEGDLAPDDSKDDDNSA